MNKKILACIIFILAVIFIPNVEAKQINMYLFYGDGCPHCEALEEYLDKEYKHDKSLTLVKYEVWKSEKNQALWEKVQDVLDTPGRGVPYFVVGDNIIQGYNEGEAYESKVDRAIKDAKENYFYDNVGIVLGLKQGEIKKTEYDPNKDIEEKKENARKEEEKKEEHKIDVPLIGTVNLSSLSLPLVAITIGLVDGFNPCAMWVLIFLITMLFNYPNKKKMWILGFTFLFASAFVYFLFMISFLNLATFINANQILKMLIAVFALIFGGYNIYRYFITKEAGCDVVDKNKRRKIMDRIKDTLNKNTFILSMIGIIALAFSVNIIELLCSLGLPVMFTEILSLNNITGIKNIMYILLYILFFMIDDIVIFVIAMKTLNIKAISNKYTKYSHLVGGIIMILIGLLMILRPEWLMFNF